MMARHRCIGPLALAAALALGWDAGAESPAARGPEVWAVVVGIEYRNQAGIVPCPGARRDASAFADWLEGPAGWDRSHVLRLDEVDGKKDHGPATGPTRVLSPTRDLLQWAMTDWLAALVRPGDAVVFWYSGQAAVVPDRGDGAARELLVPVDARPDRIDESGWTPEAAIDALMARWPDRDGVPAVSVVSLLDTSLHGRGRPYLAPPRGDRSGGERLLDRLARWPGASAWLSADGRPSVVDEKGSLFARSMAAALGPVPTDLATALDRLRRAPGMASQGFRARGGIGATLTLGRAPVRGVEAPVPRLVVQKGHAGRIRAMAESVADGGRLITASEDSSVRIWGVGPAAGGRGWDLLRTLPPGQYGMTSLAVSPAGDLIVAGDQGGTVRFHDEGREAPRPTPGATIHRESVITATALLPGSRQLASLDEAGRLALWDLDGGNARQQGIPAAERVRRIAVAREGGGILLAAAPKLGKVLLFAGDGEGRCRQVEPQEGPEDPISALDLSHDGRILAVGYQAGQVLIWDAARHARLFAHKYPGGITALKLGPGGLLGVGLEDDGYLARAGDGGPGRKLPGIAGTVVEVAFSPDGRTLASRTSDNLLALWSIEGREAPTPRPFAAGTGQIEDATALLFGGDNRGLYVGMAGGEVRAWDLGIDATRPPSPTFRIAPHLGRVARLAVAPDAAQMLTISPDPEAWAILWDLKEGAARTLAGRWTAGVFLPDGRHLLLAGDVQSSGEPTLVDRASGVIRRGARFPRPRLAGGRDSEVNFVELVASKDGRLVAGRTDQSQDQFLCVWPASGGEPRVLGRAAADDPRSQPYVALAFSPDGETLVALARDGLVRQFHHADGRETAVSLAQGGRKPRIDAAAIATSGPLRILTACEPEEGRSRVEVWEVSGAKAEAVLRESIAGTAGAVAFVGDGSRVAAAGDSRVVAAWSVGPGRPVAGIPPRAKESFLELDHPERHHADRVNGLVAWPSADSVLFASGGEDATTRLWKLDPGGRKGSLLGVFTASPERPRDDPGDEPRESEWLAFTPEGVFAGTRAGESLVKFLRGNRVVAMEQLGAALANPTLTDDLRRGVRQVAEVPLTPPPSLVIDPPRPGEVPDRDVTLTVSWADPDGQLSDFRLYHNGTPIRVPPPGPGDKGPLRVKVRLADRVNRFYAMAGRPGRVDSRSGEVPILYTGPEAIAGKVHVLALGVGRYAPGNKLQYAGDDAREVGEFLGRRGLGPGGEPGLKIILTDEEVTRGRVQDAFSQIRAAVHRRPEDTVVLFLAGHADVLDSGRDEKFSLLLAGFPFPKGAPDLAFAGVRGGARGVESSKDVLPYYLLYNELLNLDALRRLVIVDACQAGAIEDEARVALLRREMDRGARKSRTSYFLAARRGELANEVSALRHGLLTYSILLGLGAPDLAPLPDDLRARYSRGADDDGDGTVTTAELRRFSDSLLPDLARRFPGQVVREGAGPALPRPAAPGQKLRTQSSDADFPLVNTPRGKPRP